MLRSAAIYLSAVFLHGSAIAPETGKNDSTNGSKSIDRHPIRVHFRIATQYRWTTIAIITGIAIGGTRSQSKAASSGAITPRQQSPS